MISVLSACANGIKCVKIGRQLHGLIVKLELTFDTKVGTGLVDMYSKCGSWECAYDVFIELGNKRNLVTWNSMIAGMMLHDQCEKAVALFIELESEVGLKAEPATWNSMIGGFSQLGKADEAFLFFRKMLSSGIKPNLRCVTSLLSACSSLSAQNYGKQIHAYVARTNIVDDDFLATAIIDMYMKCGLPSWAHTFFDMFDKKPKDPAFWNAMISGYGKHGMNEFAFEIFGQMVREKIKPNSVTFSCLLSACSHVDRVDMGFQIFRLMIVEFGVSPSSKHMGILIDLLSRSGKLDEAFELLQGTSENSAAMMASVLGYSEMHLDSRMGEEMARRILELEPENPVPFVVLSNIYAGQDRWKDVHRIRELINEKGLRKVPGLSSAATLNPSHFFTPQYTLIAKLAPRIYHSSSIITIISALPFAPASPLSLVDNQRTHATTTTHARSAKQHPEIPRLTSSRHRRSDRGSKRPSGCAPPLPFNEQQRPRHRHVMAFEQAREFRLPRTSPTREQTEGRRS
ncbi:Pentatricopeptide repeat-containing protein [Striga hermonthica]|uniref:Pentatricopeptide repeat-containing protein n=1 Tax=Striga hermonthica TaxID=68872 RepID=A0A9N7N4B3_STRHE|nr:Pentatricopeptide repeat-containing protein [Striga hermonthica]